MRFFERAGKRIADKIRERLGLKGPISTRDIYEYQYIELEIKLEKALEMLHEAQTKEDKQRASDIVQSLQDEMVNLEAMIDNEK